MTTGAGLVAAVVLLVAGRFAQRAVAHRARLGAVPAESPPQRRRERVTDTAQPMSAGRRPTPPAKDPTPPPGDLAQRVEPPTKPAESSTLPLDNLAQPAVRPMRPAEGSGLPPIPLRRRTAAATLLLAGPVGAAALLGIGLAAGRSPAELGLATGGAALAAGGVGVMLAAYAIVVLIPVTRRMLRGHRLPARAAVRTALLEIPLATVLLEEVAFRGVLWGLVAHEHGGAWATVVTAALFGLWHVPPMLGRDRWLAIAGTVLFTALAGVVLGELRDSGGGLLAPVAAHWAANGLGVLASAAVWWSAPEKPA